MDQGVFILFPLLANVLIIELERWVEDMLQRQLSFMEQEKEIHARDLSTRQKRYCKSVQKLETRNEISSKIIGKKCKEIYHSVQMKQTQNMIANLYVEEYNLTADF